MFWGVLEQGLGFFRVRRFVTWGAGFIPMWIHSSDGMGQAYLYLYMAKWFLFHSGRVP